MKAPARLAAPTIAGALVAGALAAAACGTSPSADDPAVLGPVDRPVEPPRGDAGLVPPDAGVPSLEGPDGGDAGSACAPVQRFTFTSPAAVPLGCDADAPVTILDAQLPASARGRALGRGRFRVRHVATNVIHFWNVRVAVGDGTTSFGLGDDVCPGAMQERGNLGLGLVSAAASRAKLIGHAGAAPCTPGALVVEAGATLDVWVEDARPGCEGKDIAFGSHYLANGVQQLYTWKTSMEAMPGVSAAVETTGPSEKLRVLAVVEGSPTPNPNTTCGAEAATLVMQTVLDGAIVATETDVVPASQGMGHLVLFSKPGAGDANEVRTRPAGLHEAKLFVGSNFLQPTTTGGCCGDGAVALIRER